MIGIGFGINKFKSFGGLSTVNFILDTVPNSVSAYSVYKLSSSYTGPCIRMYNPLSGIRDIGFDENNLIDVAAIELFANGQQCYVNRVYDQSGSGGYLEQTNVTYMPYITQENGTVWYLNGIPSIVVDNPGNTSYGNPYAYMSHPKTFPTGDQNYSMYLVGSFNSFFSTGIGHGIYPKVYNGDRRILQVSPEVPTSEAHAIRYQGGNTIFNPTGTPITGQHQTSFWRGGPVPYSGREDGVDLTLASATTGQDFNFQSDSAFSIFNGGSSTYDTPSPSILAGKFQEMIWYLGDLSENNLTIEQDQKLRFNTP